MTGLPTDGRATAAGGTPPSGTRAAQKAQTRIRIRDTARACFSEQGFAETPIEAIAERAQVSRATVYFHYSSKNAMLADLLRQDWDRQLALFDRIADVEAVDHDTVRGWLDRLVSAVRSRHDVIGLYTFILSQDEAIYRELVMQRDRLVERLGRRFAAFAVGHDRHRRLAAHMILYQVEQFCAYCTKEASAEDITAGTDVLARNFLAFVTPAPPD